MRRIRLNDLVVPAGWEGKASAAAKEVADAAPEDRSAAIKRRDSIWGEIKDALANLSNKKCWYCESPWVRDDCAVDHYRPKGAVVEDEAHPGYWWLAFTKENYRFCCKLCNEFRLGKNGDEDGGKRAHFPLLDGGVRATCVTDDLIDERAALLDPIVPVDPSKLSFTTDGGVVSTFAEEDDGEEYSRAMLSIEIYNLWHGRLVSARAQICDQATTLLTNIDANYSRWRKHRAAGNIPAQNTALENIQAGTDRLDKMMQPCQPFSAAVKSVLSAEDFSGRPWLEGLLA